MNPYKVYFVDDHPVVIHGFKKEIEKDQGLKVCGETSDPSIAIKEIKTAGPDIVVSDISFPEFDGFQLIQEICTMKSEIPVLVASYHDELLFIKAAMNSGAKGYYYKGDLLTNFHIALKRILTGGSYYSEWILPKITYLMNHPSFEKLSTRESQVLMEMGLGNRPKEIALSLHMSISTVGTHIEKIMDKLNINDRKDLYKYAHQLKYEKKPLL